MEQPCYKCGQAVEEGTAFCPHCSAPQIRVVIAEPPAGVSLSHDGVTTSEGSAPLPVAQTAVALPFRGAHILKPCALAAFVASILVTLGLNIFVAMLGVGFLAIVFYRQRLPGLGIKTALGAGIGALGGALWFAMSSIVGTVIVILMHKGPELRTQLIARIEQAASQTSDPQAHAVFDQLKGSGGIELMIVLGLVFAFLASIILGALGGTLGATLLGRRDKT
jgi:hypothetical protein